MRHPVYPMAVPPDSLSAHALPIVHYADAYRVTIPAAHPNVVALARLFFTAQPAWVTTLFRVRDAIERLFGLTTAAADAPPDPHTLTFEPGTTIEGILRVVARTPDEIVLAADDRHLDVRLSFLLQTHGAERRLVIPTVVRCNTWFGRAYFQLLIRPVHRRMVPAILRNMVVQLRAATDSASGSST